MVAPRKVLFITTDLSGGGAQAALFRLVTSPALSNFSPEVISLVDEGVWGVRFREAGIPVSGMGMTPGAFPGFGATARLLNAVRAARPALMQGWMYHGNLAASFAALAMRRHRPKIVWGIRHGLHDPRSDSRSTRLLIRLGGVMGRSPAGIIFNSYAAANQHFRCGYPEEASLVIPNGVNIEGFAPDPNIKREWRDRLEIPSSAVVIGTLARYHPTKDFPTMIRVLAELNRAHRGGGREVYGVFAGEGVTTRNAELMQIVREQGIERFVRLVGRVEDPRTVLSAFDVGLLASRSEAFPNFVLEAMAGALPVVVTDVGDCRILVGDSGSVCAPGDVAGLTDSLNQLLNDEAERAARGRRARERAVSEYSLERVSATYADYYRKILAL